MNRLMGQAIHLLRKLLITVLKKKRKWVFCIKEMVGSEKKKNKTYTIKVDTVSIEVAGCIFNLYEQCPVPLC